jgi:uncharacterized protein HemX
MAVGPNAKEAGMGDGRTWITAVIALVVGAAIGYFVAQGQVGDLQARLSTAESEMAQANERAGSMAAEAETLAAENQRLAQELETARADIVERDALIAELEAQAAQAPVVPEEEEADAPQQ